MSRAIVRVKNLKKYFPIKRGLFRKTVGYVKAVDNVSFEIEQGSTLGLVGESGCGKTTLGRCLVGLIKPTAGEIYFKDKELTSLSNKELKELRKHIQIVFQDPYVSLDPRMKAMDLIGEPLKEHLEMSEKEVAERVKRLLLVVGLKEEHMKKYPHELSGGQNQRVAIARAIVLNPEFLVLDEPTSALDVSVQAQVLNLLKTLQKEFNLTYLFISHNLSVVHYMSDVIGVMYLGDIIELGPAEEIYLHPAHPYTKALFDSVYLPIPESLKKTPAIKGEPESADKIPSGCRFHTRCPFTKDICKKEEPEKIFISKSHWVKCHFPL